MRMYASSEKVIFVPSWQPKKSQEWPLTFFWGFKWISMWFTIWCLKKFELLEICSQTAFQVQGEKNFAMESMSPAANTRAQCSETCWSWMCWSVAGHLNPTVSGWTQIHSPGLWIFKILCFCSSLDVFSWVFLDFGNNSCFLFQRDEYPSVHVIVCLLVSSVCKRDDSSFMPFRKHEVS